MNHEAPAEFWCGVEQFNQGEFYACHDTLEEIWLTAIDPQKSFYQGILQIAVALYHLTNHNWQGSVTLLGSGIRRLSPYVPDYMDVDVAHLIHQSQGLLTHLQTIGPEAIAPSPDGSSPLPLAPQWPTVRRLSDRPRP
ncbi:MAG: DUF309 domain-containing protein [Synechococcales bacterium]|nr:DUF309 domain-containing protein [Synechococcales bacterium]